MGSIRGRSHPQVEGDGVMGTFTIGHGLGMLATGLTVIAVIGTIMYLTVSAIEDNRIKQEREKKAREKIYGLD